VLQCIHFKYYSTQIENQNTVRNMPNCPKCNSKVTEAMSFCPNCGASLKAAPPPAPAPAPTPTPAPAPPVRQEKQEKHEKGEKGEKREKQEPEKGEKHEKGGLGLLGPVIGGIVLIMLGIMAYLSIAQPSIQPMLGAYFLVIIGIVVLIAAIYGAMMASRRHPPA
jgi:ribosomal protein S27AE